MLDTTYLLKEFENAKFHIVFKGWSDEELEINLVDDVDDFISSFKLVHDQYKSHGYCNGEFHGLFYNIHHLSCYVQVLNLKQGPSVIATLTKFIDSDLFGLPMDALYKSELDELRKEGRIIVEYGSLAANNNSKLWHKTISLQKYALAGCLRNNTDDVCITVNPRHASYYKKFGFMDLGPEKHYDYVNAPAVALRLPLDDLKREFIHDSDQEYQKHKHMPVPTLPTFKVNKEMLQHLVDFKPELFQKITEPQKHYFSDYLGLRLPKKC